MQRILLIILIVTSFFGSAFSQDSLKINKTGLFTGLNFGTWFPDNKNKVLGNPPIIGFTLDFKGIKNSFGLNFDLIGWPQGKTTEPVTIKFGDSLLIRNEYFGAQITIDYCRQFLETKRFVFEGMCGIGYGELTYYNPDQYTHIDKKSLILSPGISIRYALSKKLFLQLKTQYCMANYKLKDSVSSNFEGNYLITKLIISGLSNNR